MNTTSLGAHQIENAQQLIEALEKGRCWLEFMATMKLNLFGLDCLPADKELARLDDLVAQLRARPVADSGSIDLDVITASTLTLCWTVLKHACRVYLKARFAHLMGMIKQTERGTVGLKFGEAVIALDVETPKYDVLGLSRSMHAETLTALATIAAIEKFASPIHERLTAELNQVSAVGFSRWSGTMRMVPFGASPAPWSPAYYRQVLPHDFSSPSVERENMFFRFGRGSYSFDRMWQLFRPSRAEFLAHFKKLFGAVEEDVSRIWKKEPLNEFALWLEQLQVRRNYRAPAVTVPWNMQTHVLAFWHRINRALPDDACIEFALSVLPNKLRFERTREQLLPRLSNQRIPLHWFRKPRFCSGYGAKSLKVK